jgi:hypothetical protein
LCAPQALLHKPGAKALLREDGTILKAGLVAAVCSAIKDATLRAYAWHARTTLLRQKPRT